MGCCSCYNALQKRDNTVFCHMDAPKLSLSFYRRNNVVTVARELLGKILITRFNDILTSGRIVETEAYNGIHDKAAHSYNGRRTNRTEVMFHEGGVAYVYLCYGLHHMFNVVTDVKEVPKAVLIRALEPLSGIDTMMQRRKKTKPDFTLTKGPGSAAQAMGIHTRHTDTPLTGNDIFICDDGYQPLRKEIIASPRIGVDYAEEDALLPYRFYINGNKYVSGKTSERK
jgi:DNA-3-methyladenine glycosylase